MLKTITFVDYSKYLKWDSSPPYSIPDNPGYMLSEKFSKIRVSICKKNLVYEKSVIEKQRVLAEYCLLEIRNVSSHYVSIVRKWARKKPEYIYTGLIHEKEAPHGERDYVYQYIGVCYVALPKKYQDEFEKLIADMNTNYPSYCFEINHRGNSLRQVIDICNEMNLEYGKDVICSPCFQRMDTIDFTKFNPRNSTCLIQTASLETAAAMRLLL